MQYINQSIHSFIRLRPSNLIFIYSSFMSPTNLVFIYNIPESFKTYIHLFILYESLFFNLIFINSFIYQKSVLPTLYIHFYICPHNFTFIYLFVHPSNLFNLIFVKSFIYHESILFNLIFINSFIYQESILFNLIFINSFIYLESILFKLISSIHSFIWNPYFSSLFHQFIHLS